MASTNTLENATADDAILCTPASAAKVIKPATTQRLVLKPVIVAVYVGRNRRQFNVHKSLLEARSPYFQTALKECWNGATREIELKDTGERSFEIFVQWLYCGEILLEESDISVVKDVVMTLVRAYILGDMLMCNAFKNSLVDLTITHLKSNPFYINNTFLEQMKTASLQETKVYRLCFRSCIKGFVDHGTAQGWFGTAHWKSMSDATLLKEMIEGMAACKQEKWKEIWEDPACDYHDHDDGEKCTSTSSQTQ